MESVIMRVLSCDDLIYLYMLLSSLSSSRLSVGPGQNLSAAKELKREFQPYSYTEVIPGQFSSDG